MMKFKFLTTALAFICSSAVAHEMTPAYPILEPSYVDSIYSTKMKLFNRREDVIYYEISVFDEKWKKVPFAVSERLIKVKYLEKTNFEVYIRRKDLKRVEYICTESKLASQSNANSLISSRICSKIKE